jgi:fatty acid CoA ligase FadD9
MHQDPELQRAVPVHAVQASLRPPELRDFQVIDRALRGYARRPALGERSYAIEMDSKTGRNSRAYKQQFATITYDALRRRIEQLSNAWARHDRHARSAGEFACILGSASTDFVTVDLACAYRRMVSVPLPANLPPDELIKIIGDVSPPVLVASCSTLPLAVSLAASASSVRSLIVMDYDARDEGELDLFNGARMQVEQLCPRAGMITLNELIEFGGGFEWRAPAAIASDDQRIASIVYTSGATGTPKGAIFNEGSTKLYWTEGVRALPKITVAYLPMNHLMGQHAVYSTLSQGGTVYFTLRSDLSALFEDIRLVRPTVLAFIPRVAQSIYQDYRMEVARRVNRGVKIEDARVSVRREMQRTYLGDRLCIGSIGGAPTAPVILEFLRSCFGIALAESYGSTESGGLTVGDNAIENVIDYRLIDAPELGYRTSDKPFPRGELLLKTWSQISGYFRNPEATSGLFDADGFLRTGDIVEERGPRHLVWLDRKNEVLKLAQGEFVAIAQLEGAFESRSALIKQIFLYGDPHRSYLLAVVVPDMELALQRLGRPLRIEMLRKAVRAALHRAGKAANLRAFEIPRAVIIETEPFTTSNGLLTNVGKRRRPQLKQKYMPALERLYESIDAREGVGVPSLEQDDSAGGIAERVARALTTTLGIDKVDPGSLQSFAAFGGDSLAAISFATLLEQVFGVMLPVSAILDPTGNIPAWAQEIVRALANGSERKSARLAKIDGHHPVIRARDLDLGVFLDRSALAETKHAGVDTRTILLTGANGFLGRFLCLAWLTHLAPENGKVVCLVRAADDALAKQRLVDSIVGTDRALNKAFRKLADESLEVVTGDLTKPALGLGDSGFGRLAARIDQVVHAGALVNHLLPYQHLFEPNVAGTAELIRFALTGRRKRFDFISSITAARFGEETADEDTSLAESIILKQGYGEGYAASKWAGEVLLRDAHASYGLPVTIFRPSMILAHRSYRGQLNLSDMFSRLLYSIVASGVAPKSFYRANPGGGTEGAHYDGLPVDFVADFIARTGADPDGDFATYNVVNIHDRDGVSLDQIVDWIISGGYPIERLDKHRSWFETFEARLSALSDEQRLHSALPILAAFRTRYPSRARKTVSGRFQDRAARHRTEVPGLTEGFIHKYLDDLRLLKLIP